MVAHFQALACDFQLRTHGFTTRNLEGFTELPEDKVIATSVHLLSSTCTNGSCRMMTQCSEPSGYVPEDLFIAYALPAYSCTDNFPICMMQPSVLFLNYLATKAFRSMRRLR